MVFTRDHPGSSWFPSGVMYEASNRVELATNGTNLLLFLIYILSILARPITARKNGECCTKTIIYIAEIDIKNNYIRLHGVNSKQVTKDTQTALET